MTTDEIIKILKDDQDNVDFDWLKEEAQPVFDAYNEAIKAVEVVQMIKEKYILYDHLYGKSVEDRNNFRKVFANAICNIMYETYRDDTFQLGKGL